MQAKAAIQMPAINKIFTLARGLRPGWVHLLSWWIARSDSQVPRLRITVMKGAWNGM